MAAIESGMKDKRSGCGILDNDYRAAFDLMVAAWPIMVLVKKGVGNVMAEWLQSLFVNVFSIVAINGIAGCLILLELSLIHI